MFLSGLRNIDFSGIGSLSGDMSRASLFPMFRDALPSTYLVGVSDEQINSILDSVFADYRISSDVSPDQATIDAAQNGISDIVKSVLGAKAGVYYVQITGVIDQLSKQRYVAVPKGYVAPSQSTAPSGSSTPVVDVPTSSGMPSRAAVFKYQAAQQAAGQSVSPSIAPPPNIQRGPLPVRRITRAHVQTPAEKKRLLLIVGSFALVFAVALGVIASRD